MFIFFTVLATVIQTLRPGYEVCVPVKGSLVSVDLKLLDIFKKISDNIENTQKY